VRCEVVERELSAQMDAGADPILESEIGLHLSTCPGCRLFAEGIRQIREGSRLEAALPLPDGLLPRIMDEIRAASVRPGRSGRERLGRLRAARAGSRPSRAGWPQLVAAFLVGVLATVVALGGLVLRAPKPALATEIPQRIADASSEVTAYRAVFDLTERGFQTLVPVRRFTAEVAFSAPERFRAEIKDLTRYPTVKWPRNDIVLGVDRSRWVITGPAVCPRQGLPQCFTGDRLPRVVDGREPFDADAVLPTDIVLPLRTLGGTERVVLAGKGKVGDREVVRVRLAYRDALPLFAYLQAGGSWRPYFPRDEVTLSLDAQSWFPIAYEVRATGAPERAMWSATQGLGPEPEGSVLFSARVRSLDQRVQSKDLTLPAISQPATDLGFQDLTFGSLAKRVGYQPLEPADLAGLARYRAGVYQTTTSPPDEALLSYTKGLSWLKILETRSWGKPALFGNMGALAGQIELDVPGRAKGDGGFAYYEPATASLGRRLSIHANGSDLYLESNLSREELLKVAASIPVTGLEQPPEWKVRRWPDGIVRREVSLKEAERIAPFVEVPRNLPPDYHLAVVYVVDAGGARGVTLYYRREGMELDGVAIRLHQSCDVPLSPPMEPDVSTVSVGSHQARYSATRNELEWVDGRVYRSISGAALGLAGLIDIAAGLAPDPGSVSHC
jgi:hypothetical protein